MATITTNSNNIFIYGDNKINVFNKENKMVKGFCVPYITNDKATIKNKEEQCIVSHCFSQCGNYFAVTLKNKQLVVYNNSLEVHEHMTVVRTVSKMCFTPSRDIVIADKTGDVYLYKNNQLTQLLGHLSMVLDVLVSDCGSYIITCDRDEKIRISRFPGAYNIENYCLGHEEFVLNLELFNDVLISSSGDGTVRFWNYLSGKQLTFINTNEYVDDINLVHSFSENMKIETVDISSLPITCMKIQKYETFAIMVISLHTYKSLQVYKIFEDLQFQFLQALAFKDHIMSFDLNQQLYVLTQSGIQVFSYENLFHEIQLEGLNDFFVECGELLKKQTQKDISVFYKRKFDNMQEYQQRKKQRIESKIK